jgi:hypothetical protein
MTADNIAIVLCIIGLVYYIIDILNILNECDEGDLYDELD